MKPLLLLMWAATFLLTLPPIMTVDPYSPSSDDSEFIRTTCNVTLYPDVCLASLSAFAGSVQKDPARLARAAISVALNKTRELGSYLAIMTGAGGNGAAADCLENVKDAAEEMKGSMKQMRELVTWTGSAESFRFQMSNVQTWLSAALTDEETCTDGFQDAADDKDDVCKRVDDLKKLTSNALALVNHYADNAIH